MIFLYIFAVMIIIIFFAISILMILYFYGSMRTLSSAPFVPVSKKDLKIINSFLKMNSGDILYDLGSGDGRVLKSVLKNNQHIKAVGYEINPLGFILSKFNTFIYKKRIDIYYKSFYSADLSSATHIFLYLFNNVLEELESKFDKELKVGTRVISIDFTFPNKKPVEIIDIEAKGKITKKLYVYIW